MKLTTVFQNKTTLLWLVKTSHHCDVLQGNIAHLIVQIFLHLMLGDHDSVGKTLPHTPNEMQDTTPWRPHSPNFQAIQL